MRYRYYSPERGRFLTRDPLGAWRDRWNWGNSYAYVGNLPTSRADPLGLMSGPPGGSPFSSGEFSLNAPIRSTPTDDLPGETGPDQQDPQKQSNSELLDEAVKDLGNALLDILKDVGKEVGKCALQGNGLTRCFWLLWQEPEPHAPPTYIEELRRLREEKDRAIGASIPALVGTDGLRGDLPLGGGWTVGGSLETSGDPILEGIPVSGLGVWVRFEF